MAFSTLQNVSIYYMAEARHYERTDEERIQYQAFTKTWK